MRRWLPIALVLLASCAGDPVVVLEITTDATVPGALSKIYIYLTGSRTPAPEPPEVCEPIMVPYVLGSAEDLPLRHAVFRGDEYDARLFYKVVGVKTGEAEPVYRGHLGRIAWPFRDEREIRVHLDRECFNLDPCPSGQQCEGGECVETEVEDVFGDPSFREGEGSCAGTEEGA